MNIQQLRQSLKEKWISYYYKNRSWLVRMRIWATYNGQRRPSSGFILATLSALEPQLEQLFPFILELNNNPDAIVAALGLNFNPEEHLHSVKDSFVAQNPQSNRSSLDQPVPEKLLSNSGSEYISDRQTASSLQDDHRLLTSNTDPTRDQAASRPRSSPVSDQHSQPTKTVSGNKPVVSMTVVTEEQNKSKSVKSIALTRVENNTVIPINRGIRMNGKSQPLTSVAIATKIEEHRTPVFPIAVGTGPVSGGVVPIVMSTNMQNTNQLVISSAAVEMESKKDKSVNKPEEHVLNQEVQHSSVNKVCKLANWIDDFCQGSGWDREEAIFIPF